VGWFIRCALEGVSAPLPWHWLNGRNKPLCACCSMPATGNFERVPYCQIHESDVLEAIDDAMMEGT
jgi:hypothetical protein